MSVDGTACCWEGTFNVHPMQMCFIIKQNVQGLSVGRDEGGRGSRHCSWGIGKGYSETWTNSGREGTAKKPTPFKKSLSHLTENWMPDKLTHAKSFFTKCLTLSNSLCFKWTSVGRHKKQLSLSGDSRVLLRCLAALVSKGQRPPQWSWRPFLNVTWCRIFLVIFTLFFRKCFSLKHVF